MTRRTSSSAGLARIVDAAADDGDASASAILERAAEELVLLVTVTRRTLGFAPDERVALSHSGGVFESDRLRDAFRRGLGDGSLYDLRRPRFDPAFGGALYAARLAGRPIQAGGV